MHTDENLSSSRNDGNTVLPAGWVSVSDLLPEKNLTIDVVIKNEYGQYRIPNAEYRLKDMWHKTERFEIYQHTDDGMQWVDVTSQVTHWMVPPVLPACR